MTKTDCCRVNFESIMEGEEVRCDDLEETTQEHIIECTKEGYCGGEIVVEEDNIDE